ncbi:hypothetical protein COJ37_03275 [Bacillus cereus]|nr:protealysin inhibitor emfourin [Bacillus cereus]PFL44544.1 hypothetical protein COJ33_31130 [Bacillus cereus]PFM02895.1 hypothetical protein COJ37_03275 [Bacillus cereus]PFT72429.1 hypothetical protein COK73_02545 [Bacillus cereus]
MHIKFSCTGGLANLHLTFQTDTMDLPEEQAKELINLIHQSNLLHLKPSEVNGAAIQGADAFSYELGITDDEKNVSFSVNDLTAPKDMLPVLDYLRNLAIKEKMEKS